MKLLPLFVFLLSLTAAAQPTVSFTFDDGNPADQGGYSGSDWNAMILRQLKTSSIKAIFFVAGERLDNTAGRAVVKSWSDAGHLIGNHTWSHKSFAAVTTEEFEKDFIRNDSVIRKYAGFTPLFRFPFLKEGDTKEKISAFRMFLREKHYTNGAVTIDASDWYIDSRLRARLKENPKTDLTAFRQFYVKHLLDRADYYEKLAFSLTGRHIGHTILLHHNLAAALFLDDLIKAFRQHGWTIINAESAYTDPVFQTQPTTVPAGESLIWALAKESKKYEGQLRYPAEDGDYEKAAMDKLGL